MRQRSFWEEYPDVKDVNRNIALIRNEKYRLLTHFTLPKSAWIDNYYIPLEKRVVQLKKKYQGNKIALQVLTRSEEEIDLYRRSSDYVGYEFFVMQKN